MEAGWGIISQCNSHLSKVSGYMQNWDTMSFNLQCNGHIPKISLLLHMFYQKKIYKKSSTNSPLDFLWLREVKEPLYNRLLLPYKTAVSFWSDRSVGKLYG